MKKLTFITILLTTPLLCICQTIDTVYLNPKGDDGTPYNYTRFGNSTRYWAGFMWNNNSPSYGDGDDFTIFTYGNRDINLRTGTGNVIIFPSSGGNVGIGTKSPSAKLDIRGNMNMETNGDAVMTFNNTDDSWQYFQFKRSGIRKTWLGLNAGNDFCIYKEGGGNIILNGGNVGVGIATPDAKLSVNGDIHTQEVRVDMNGWPDFVFTKDYELSTIDEVELHIKENGHLKDIPSEAEVKVNGINLGEMDAKLLQKIEELTLYIIDLQKQVNELKQTQNK